MFLDKCVSLKNDSLIEFIVHAFLWDWYCEQYVEQRIKHWYDILSFS
jgi:hypothetical protein